MWGVASAGRVDAIHLSALALSDWFSRRLVNKDLVLSPCPQVLVLWPILCLQQ
jgi:hypothetical protein